MAQRSISVVPTNNQQFNCQTPAHKHANQEQVQVSIYSHAENESEARFQPNNQQSIISTLESKSQCSGQEVAGRNLVFSNDECAQQKKNTSENSHETFPSCFIENLESSGEEETPLNSSEKDRALFVTNGKSLDQSQPIASGKCHPFKKHPPNTEDNQLTQRSAFTNKLESDLKPDKMKTSCEKVKSCSATELHTNSEDTQEEKCCSKDDPPSLKNRQLISCDNEVTKEKKCPPETLPHDHSDIAAMLGPSLLEKAISSVRCPPLKFNVNEAERVFTSIKSSLLQYSRNTLLCSKELTTHWRLHMIMPKACTMEGLLGLNDLLFDEFTGYQLSTQWSSSRITTQHGFQLSTTTFSKCFVLESGWEHLSNFRNNPKHSIIKLHDLVCPRRDGTAEIKSLLVHCLTATTSVKYCTYPEVKRALSQSTQGIAINSLHKILESPSKHIWYRKWQIINYNGKQYERLSLHEICIFHNSLYQLHLHLQKEVRAVRGHLIEVLSKPSQLSLHSLHHEIKFDSCIWLDDTDTTVAVSLFVVTYSY